MQIFVIFFRAFSLHILCMNIVLFGSLFRTIIKYKGAYYPPAYVNQTVKLHTQY